MTESNILKTIFIRLSAIGCRLFRVNVGRAWVGDDAIKVTAINAGRVRLQPGDVVLRNGRRLNTGVPNGYSDATGWTPVVIAGRQVAVFTAIEAKSAKGRATEEQLNFLQSVHNAGGISGIARSEDEAAKIIADYIHQHK